MKKKELKLSSRDPIREQKKEMDKINYLNEMFKSLNI